jgi:hydroxymethylglutaryl-CoA lyase
MKLPRQVRLVEVGARDGLQNEPDNVATKDKIALIDRLSASGLQAIEVSSFVSPKRVPQMADAAEVFAGIDRQPGVQYPVLVPNRKGLDAALSAGVSEIAVFAATSETFSQRNIECSIAQSLDRFSEVAGTALAAGLKVRGYLSCAAGCPYEGVVSENQVAELALRLIELGCYEVSLGDTIGVANPLQVSRLLQTVTEKVPIQQLAVHFHDTYGQALANILAALQEGVAVIDSSVAGLGGCPFAPGAAGNVASEDVLYMLNGLGIHTGVDLEQLIGAGQFICGVLERTSRSKVALASMNCSE